MTTRHHHHREWQFCQLLPKVELHAHLHGCVRLGTLRALLQAQPSLHAEETAAEMDWLNNLEQARSTGSLRDSFRLFALIHRVVTCTQTLRRIIHEAVDDFVRDGVHYVELRTTPRCLDDCPNFSDYLGLVVQTLEECQAKWKTIQVRLLVSINRGHSLQDARRILHIALQWYAKTPEMVLGMDFSGNPNAEHGGFDRFVDLYQIARSAGMKITLHFAEVRNEVDTEAILDFAPHRVGHACCLSPAQMQRMIDMRIPIEVCLTSNLMTRPELLTHCVCCAAQGKRESTSERCQFEQCMVCTSSTAKEQEWKRDLMRLDCICGISIHPLQTLIQSSQYPVTLCTDDPGVFQTSNSLEYYRYLRSTSTTVLETLIAITVQSVDMIFDETEKPRLRQLIQAFSASQFPTSQLR